MFPLEAIELGVFDDKLAIPPLKDKLKSVLSRAPLPPTALKTASENVVLIVLLFDAIEEALIIGKTFSIRLTVLLD